RDQHRDRITPCRARLLQAAHDLPHVRTVLDRGPTTRRPGAKHDPRKLPPPDPPVDQPLRDPGSRLTHSTAQPLETIEHRLAHPRRQLPPARHALHYIAPHRARTNPWGLAYARLLTETARRDTDA